MSDIIQKTQRLSSAIYLITSFFADQEPLKWRLRTLSADLVSEVVKDKSFLVREITTLFSLAKSAGLVSEANYEILSHELSKAAQEGENPLNTILSREYALPERVVAEPRSVPTIKDNTAGRESLTKPVLKEFGAVSVKKNTRQSIIIALLKRKKEVMIKDVVPLISGCSEKTIQRELSQMVESGILRRIGEKRWSRYTLA